jgi:hypothetical protein
MISTKIDRRWIGLHGPHIRIWWMKKELTQTTSISAAHTQPTLRCGKVPFGAESCTRPSPNAAMAAKACT